MPGSHSQDFSSIEAKQTLARTAASPSTWARWSGGVLLGSGTQPRMPNGFTRYVFRVASPGSSALFIVPCFTQATFAKARAMKNNRGGCLGCLNGCYGTDCWVAFCQPLIEMMMMTMTFWKRQVLKESHTNTYQTQSVNLTWCCSTSTKQTQPNTTYTQDNSSRMLTTVVRYSSAVSLLGFIGCH